MKTTVSIGLCTLALTLAATPAGAATVTRDEALALVDTWLEAQRAYADVPGMSAGVVHDQEVVWIRAWGLADPVAERPAGVDTIYSICSISKLFTSIAVMQLRDAGELELDDPVAEHLPWFELRDEHPHGPPITVWGLLTHSAGIPREADYPYWSPPDFAFPTREQIRQRLAAQATLFPAQTFFQYSNLGLTLTGEIVAEVEGRPYDEAIRERILDPLGLDDTRAALPEGPAAERLAVGYAPRGRGPRAPLPLFDAAGIAPAAGFSSTVPDLLDFASWQFRVLAGEEEAVLGRNTLREMQRVQWMDPSWEVARGLGFGVYRVGETTYVGHSGSCPGFRTTLRLQTDDEVAVVLMANLGGDLELESWATQVHRVLEPVLETEEDQADAAAAAERGEEADPGAGEPEEEAGPELDDYVGTYSYAPWGGEVAVVRWKGGLAMLPLPTDDPLEALNELRHVEGDRFRRLRDDEKLAEPIVFERGEAGLVVALRRHENAWPRIEP